MNLIERILRFMKLARAGAIIAVSVSLAACGGQGGTVPSQALSELRPQHSTLGKTVWRSPAETYNWTPRYVTLIPQNLDYRSLKTQRDSSITIPFYTGSVKSPLDGKTYTYSIVGANPKTSNTSTRIAYVPIVARITFSDGTVLDPTLPGCHDAISIEDRFFKGPNFKATKLISNGVTVGKVQITDAFQRAEFWAGLQPHSSYHTLLKASTAPIVVDVSAPSGSSTVAGVCSGSGHRVGEIPINAYDTFVQQLAAQYSKSSEIPVVLSYNVVLKLPSGCCATGYHSAFSRGSGTQVYAVGGYFDFGVFKNGIPADIETWTHELGEVLNDPFVNNSTPAWGHVGQVQNCQRYLEVGDPLTGTRFELKYKGFTYHPQELAFFDWFFRTPSQGTGGVYSFKGTFRSAQGACT
jgi:hypothetical protein